jgi:uncharacterized membrane protein (UPF0182 family)
LNERCPWTIGPLPGAARPRPLRGFPVKHLNEHAKVNMEESKSNKKWVRILVAGLIAVGILLGLLLLAGILAIDYLVDIWWYDSVGYLMYYLQRLFYRYAVFAGVTLFFFIIFFINFRLTFRFMPKLPAAPEPSPKGGGTRLFTRFRTGSLLIYTPLCLVLSILIAIPFFRNWERFLFYIFGPSAGVGDPVFGHDVSFYLFSYPIYILVQKWLFIACAAMLVGVLLLYSIDRGLFSAKNKLTRAARWHLSVLVLLLFLVGIWDFALQRFALVYTSSHTPTFFGPGYVELKVVLPLIWLSIIFLAATAVGLLVVFHTRKGIKVLAALVVVLAMVLALRYTDFLPDLVNEYVVKPNQEEKERPYIAMNIAGTLNAFNLSDVKEIDFEHERFPEDVPLSEVTDMLRNIPVWNERTLETVFQQLQELRTYYKFDPVSVGRYTVAGKYQQVFLSAREIEYANLPGSAQNWINRHLTYTHGIGAVVTPAVQDAGSPIVWYMSGIPPRSNFGMRTEQPRIYFGRESYDYVIAPNDSQELDYPQGNENVMYDYTGKGGVPVGSLFRKLMFAYYFKEKNIFFSSNIKKESRVLFRRNIVERVRRLAPFLVLDRTPYLVVTPQGLQWVIDAYTTSSWYPASAAFPTRGTSFNYMRNSVKIVVDAYDGGVDFYIYDESDPIINAYRRIYPGVFKSKEHMPESLQKHVRYPKDFFDTQMRIYARYHQTAPRVFYNNEDLWTFAETVSSGETVPFEPYYLTLDVVGEDKALDFILLLPMMPKGRNNMSSLAIAASDAPNYGKITVFTFPKGKLVYGPEQIDALINQDTEIAEQFTLWDQVGSSVERGTMLLLPFKNSILFIQPIFLRSTSAVNIPQLQRVIMSEGQTVVMAKSLEEAYAQLQEEVQKETRQRRMRFPGIPLVEEEQQPPVAPPAGQPAAPVEPGHDATSPAAPETGGHTGQNGQPKPPAQQAPGEQGH